MRYASRFIVTALLTVLFVLPLLLLGMLALASRWSYPALLPESLSLRSLNFIIRQSPGFGEALLSSLTYSLAAAFLAFCLCLLPARALGRESFRLKGLTEALFLSPILLPVMTFSMGLHIIFLRMGLSGSRLGVILVLVLYNAPYMLRALTEGYRQIPRELSQTAANLGAGLLRTLASVEIPGLLPALSAGFPILFLTAFSEYFLVFLIGGGAVPSLTGYLYPFIRGSDYPVSSLLVLIFLMLPVLLFLLQEGLLRRIYRTRSIS